MAMTLEEVLGVYRGRLAHFEGEKRAAERRRGEVRWAMLLVLAVVAWRARMAFLGVGPVWEVLLPLAAEGALLWWYLELESRLGRVGRLLLHTDRAIERADERVVQSGRTGEVFREALHAKRREPHEVPPARREGAFASEHLYERDLNVLGEASLFGLMATVRTGLGERGLARYLLEPPPGATGKDSFAENMKRQDAVRELAPKVTLREEIAVMGTSRFQQVPANFFDEWLEAPAPVVAGWYRVALAITAVLLTGLLIATLAGVAGMMPNLLAVAAIQMALAWRLRARLTPILESTVRLSNHIQLVSEGLAVMQKESFEAEKLRDLQATPADAVRLLARLQNQVAVVQQRDKGVFMAVSLLLAGGTQAGISIANWKRAHGAAMRGWLDAWSEFEALNAVATYAFEHPENVYPELLPPDHAAVFQGTAIGHPLLPRGGCVVNDVTLNPANRFYLISGSNMAGKSTLLRAIGLNAVLAYAGAPVRAACLRLSPMRIGASLALIDSLAESKSKFMAEVERLAAIVRLSESGPVLFLIDELFSGTNSNDRRAAAEAVLTALLKNGAIGALSTHDLALTSLADGESYGRNVHMASPDDEDPLGFDYRLKTGVNRSSNALAILRMMGLET
ncbi:hypothetical protein FTO74_02205 [Granulicella sp. WH15]|uniref:MutS-related protein n=1 Tax=Granulicella sp. WH15 TaxID=2602070 RepID=UPI001366CDAF|nr:hypothetical protein [Granulicella sp. WH15]QHN02315.1 hypothetical protein FTO74_02205 [Granulicella sp. WH15]